MLGVIRLTFRELTAKKITICLFIVCTLIWSMLAFALNLDIVDGALVGMKIFGNEATPNESTVDDQTGEVISDLVSLESLVLGIEMVVAGICYWGSILLALFATAPLINALMEKGRVDLLLSKPISRLQILSSQVLGVVLVMTLLTTYLMGAIWLVMSTKSGIWNFQFLVAIAIVIVMFAVMYGVVLLISVNFNSTALALITTYGLIIASIVLGFHDELAPQINLPWRHVYVTLYHILPNFSEMTMIVAQLTRGDAVESWYPLVSSVSFGAVMYALAGWRFARRDF